MEIKKEKLSLLEGDTAVIVSLPDYDFKVIATAKGVQLKGESPVFFGRDEIDLLARMIGEACQEHVKLKPKIEITTRTPE